MRPDKWRTPRDDFSWPDAFRTEMDTWKPERLPGRFRMRDRDGRPIWARRPFGVAVAVLLMAIVASVLAPARPTRPIEAKLGLGPAVRVTPLPALAPTPVGVWPVTPAQATQSAVPSAGAPTPPPAARAASTPNPAPTSAPSQPAQPTPAPTPTGTAPPPRHQSPQPSPTPSPGGICLPIIPLCL